ncbi:unnamed protein product [Diabrotica balteata]|uniref:Lipase domain-containing protein n=1 Tax=Diabrotica balteata TaxID=107213 RepID=A0A9N9SUE6_DIABA|nr:unnamed protein product [Diabrotica balteata]
MKVIFCLLGVVTLVVSTPVNQEDLQKYYLQGSIPCPFKEAINYNVSSDDIKVYFRNKQHPDSSVPIDINQSSEVDALGFSPNKDTMFIVHGWHNGHDSPVCDVVSKAVLQNNDINVFLIDWNAIARNLYVVAYKAVPEVGKLLGTLIRNLVNNNKLDLNKAAIVGHSLGAHVAGLAGHELNGAIHHIVGLDPALPCFDYNDVDQRLDPTDAKYVEVIHTCAGFLGFDVDIGDSDYYPNGGKNQPGCDLDVVGICRHGRSYLYYSESLISGGFAAKQCNSYKDFNNNQCNAGRSNMGEYNINTSARGGYYLNTNSKSPYAQH